MKLKPSKRVIGLLAAMLAVEIAAAGALFLFQRAALKETERELAAKRQEERESQWVAQRLEQTEANVRNDEDRLAFLERNVSDADYVPTLLRDLERLALATQNRLLGVRPEPQDQNSSASATARSARQKEIDKQMGEKGAADDHKAEKPKPPTADYDALYIRVHIVGGYPQVQAFLQRLTRFPKVIGAEEVQVRPHHQPGANAARTNLLDAELRLKAYILKQSPAPALPGGEHVEGAVS